MQAEATVLYVEDDAVNMALVKKLLRSEGFKVLEAPNGWAGLAMAEQHKPDLILMDMNMPDLDGYQATRRLKRTPELKHIPVVALTANAMDGDRQRSIECGCEGHITKPININTFIEEIRDYVLAGRAPGLLSTGTDGPVLNRVDPA